MTNINVINRSTVIPDDEANKVVDALQKQVVEHWYPAWGSDCQLFFTPLGKTNPIENAWEIIILDDSDQAGALGYHDLTSTGMPIGKVFAKTDKQYGLSWSVTASHELLEMLGDPGINLTALVEGKNGGRLYSYEVGDPCEADEYGYLIDGVLVSDFVFPAWFESFWSPGATQFDYKDKIKSSFELLPGGYIGYLDINSTDGWQQLTAQSSPKARKMRPAVGSRRERRRTPRKEWQFSNPAPDASQSATAGTTP